MYEALIVHNPAYLDALKVITYKGIPIRFDETLGMEGVALDTM